jgi:hypothetical protein
MMDRIKTVQNEKKNHNSSHSRIMLSHGPSLRMDRDGLSSGQELFHPRLAPRGFFPKPLGASVCGKELA